MYEARQNKEKVSRAIFSQVKHTKLPCFRLKDNRMLVQMCPSVKRSKFTPDEDKLIVSLHETYGDNWNTIATLLGNRTVRQVRERYKNYLNPNIRHEPWSEGEDNTLQHLIGLYGCKWSFLQHFFHGRSDVQIKNRALSLKLFYSRRNTMGNPANFYSNTFCDSLALLSERGEYDVFSETFLDPTDGKWYDILGRNVDVGDTTDAVRHWNDRIRLLPKAERKQAILDYRNDPTNFRPENSSNNRSNGAKLGERYLPPV